MTERKEDIMEIGDEVEPDVEAALEAFRRQSYFTLIKIENPEAGYKRILTMDFGNGECHRIRHTGRGGVEGVAKWRFYPSAEVVPEEQEDMIDTAILRYEWEAQDKAREVAETETPVGCIEVSEIPEEEK